MRTRGIAEFPVARSVAELRQCRAELNGDTVAFVPTMGALHEGHRSLFRLAAERADRVVASIFVNPLQFGPGEDYARYPRVLDSDLETCASEGVDLAFVPTVNDLYPPGRQVMVDAGQMGTVLEGAARPGHFNGVLTVVLKLFNLVRPDIAVFGQKDAQQLACIRRMVVDLNIDVEIVGAPTVREPDGLALSSRNRYLSLPERQSALALSAALRDGARQADRCSVLEAARRPLTQTEAADPSFRVQYVELVSPASFGPVAEDYAGPAVLAVAAAVGGTRLIDNVMVHLTGAG